MSDTKFSHVCRHKNFFPIFPKEILGIVLFVILAVLSGLAGMGGGSILVPILLIFFTFTTKEAINLANVFTFFSGTIKFAISLRTRHPKIKHRTIIEYNMVLILIPSMLLGSFIGSTVSPMIPELLQMICMIVVLILAGIDSINKTMALFKKETEDIEKKKQHTEDKEIDGKRKRRKQRGKPGNPADMVKAESSADEFGGRGTDLENNTARRREEEEIELAKDSKRARKNIVTLTNLDKVNNKLSDEELGDDQDDGSNITSVQQELR